MLTAITRLFPLWALLLSVVAFMLPTLFTDLKSFIVPLLTLIMLSMGLTLSVSDFKFVVEQKRAILLGVILQFTVMPILAFVIGKSLGLDDALLVGMVLVGSVAGGTASNVICFLAKGHVALSITMTAVSTLLGVIFTPLLVELLAGQTVDVPIQGMLLSLVKIVLLPVGIGLLLNSLLKSTIDKVSSLLPLVSMAAIVIIIAIVVALNANNIATIGPLVAVAVFLHNAIGLLSGYWGARLLGFNETVCRTVAIEVGMQNSGLAVALSMKFFSPLSALPGAIFSIWHNIAGSLLAGYWSSKTREDKGEKTTIPST